MISPFEETSKYVRSIIFGFLRVKDILPLLFVNKKVRQYTLGFFAEHKQIKLKENDILRISSRHEAKTVFTYFPNLTTLKINTYNLSVENFEYLPKTITKLGLLSCKEGLLLRKNLYQHLRNRLSLSLKELKIEYHDSDSINVLEPPPKDFLTTLEEFAKNMKSLEKLSFQIIFKGWHPYDLKTLNNTFFYCFHQNSESLKVVNFNYLIVHPFVPKPNKTIKSIKIGTSEGFLNEQAPPTVFGLNNSTLIFLANQFTDLEEVSITDHMANKKQLSENAISSLLDRHSNLKTLCLNCYSDKFTISETSILQSFSTLTNIEKFGMASCKNLCLSSILSIEPNLSSIRYLTLDFTDTDDSDMNLISDLLGKLEFLSLKCCYKISEEGFISMCQHLHNLKSCNFKYDKAFGSTALHSLLFYSPKLKKIKLGNNNLSNDDLAYLFRKGNKLKEIVFTTMNSTDDFSQECFSRIVNEKIVSWRLKVLDISSNLLIKDLSISQLCQISLPYLSYLSVEKCQKLTKKSLEIIAGSNIGKTLFAVNFYIKAVVIDKDVFHKCKKQMKSLAILYLCNCSKHRSLKEYYDDIHITLMEH